ncbi:hypothetical protein RR46_05545 [Papilio xuthus]|uniref:Uncharacterized protein n=1 Tax=Papilio xuthus TaxID=66420 RepID=A0A194Q1D1_PAPXU|nr:hypothetical protein RR46_05545 [Papilio xuthus]
MQQILNRLVSLEEQQVVSSSQRMESSGRAAVEVAKSAVPVATISAERVPAVEPAVSMPPPSQLGEAVTASSLQGRASGFNDSVLTGASRERYTVLGLLIIGVITNVFLALAIVYKEMLKRGSVNG